MRDGLLDLLERADLAVASCSGVLSRGQLDPVVHKVRSLRARLGYPEDVLVVALSGGTGSGKSSLFNVLVGEEVADVGGVRPTTEQPQAAVPREASGALEGYLDLIGIAERHAYDGRPLCLIDLPDIDSIDVEHRRTVDDLLPLVDVILWVTDPEKYRDARLHREYLQPMAGYASQFVCVLNQADRLGDDQLMPILADLSRALAEDGLREVPVLATAASPTAGPPIGIAELSDELEAMRTRRATLYDKLLIDLETVVRELDSALGPNVEFDAPASTSLASAVESLRGGDTAGAVDGLVSFLDDVADQAGGVTGESMRRLVAAVPGHVTRVASEMRRSAPGKRRLLRRESASGAIDPKSQLNEAVLRPARALLAKRALAGASVTELAVATAGLRSATSR